MINHRKCNNRVIDTFYNLQKEYDQFSKDITLENRYKLKEKVREHREALNNLVSCINDIFLK